MAQISNQERVNDSSNRKGLKHARYHVFTNHFYWWKKIKVSLCYVYGKATRAFELPEVSLPNPIDHHSGFRAYMEYLEAKLDGHF